MIKQFLWNQKMADKPGSVEFLPTARNYWLSLVRDIILWAVVSAILSFVFVNIILPAIKTQLSIAMEQKWEKDSSEGGVKFDVSCEYRWKITDNLGEFGKKWALREVGYIVFYATIVRETVIATSYSNNSYWIDYVHRSFMRNGAESSKEFSANIERRCPK